MTRFQYRTKFLHGGLFANLRVPLLAYGLAATMAVFIWMSTASSAGAVDAPISMHGQSESVRLGLDKSLVIDLPRDARDVLVSNPAIADAVMRTARRAYLIGMEVGQTNVFFFDEHGTQIAALEVDVERDLTTLRHKIQTLIPDSSVIVDAMNDNIVLSGSVRTPLDSQKAVEIAQRFIGDEEKVLSMLAVRSKEQVQARVQIVEVRRTVLKQFGIDFPSAVNGIATNVINGGVPGGALLSLNNAFSASNTLPTNALIGSFDVGSNGNITAVVQAMERQGLARVLAEPTLSAISGEAAKFLAGGEFPIPVGRDEDGNLTIEFKEFGVGLGMTPVVMSEERISLRVNTEVSELSAENALVLQGVTLPALTVRRAETTVELPSGGSLVMAGLIRQDRNYVINGLPVVKDLPVIGQLFRSQDFVNNETEMLVIVTPYIVAPAARREFDRPDKNLTVPNDFEAALFGRLNEVYGVTGANPSGTYHGSVGFIVK
ncbi:MAG: type II and III secretion system protein family protein [Pseudomonadota bacterium]